MNESRAFDVIVVGAGPGGAVASKRCAEGGLHTLLIEKKNLPREKVCSGMVMGRWASHIIETDFGRIPGSVLTDPPVLSGHRFHVGAVNVKELEWPTPIAWRRDLDFWMVEEARKSGVIVREGHRVAGVALDDGCCRITLHKGEETETCSARFVVGADGAASVVRRSIFPELKVRYSGPLRECYRGELDLDRDFIHWFFPKGLPRPRFNVNHKGDVFLLEGSGLRELRKEIGETLSPYGFHPDNKPQWKDGCAIAMLHDQLLSGTFRPARSNLLLIGDAAGLILPISFEGIGSALKSGVLAAEAIMASIDNGTQVESIYMKGLESILEPIRRLCIIENGLKTASTGNAEHLAKALQAAYRETLLVQET